MWHSTTLAGSDPELVDEVERPRPPRRNQPGRWTWIGRPVSRWASEGAAQAALLGRRELRADADLADESRADAVLAVDGGRPGSARGSPRRCRRLDVVGLCGVQVVAGPGDDVRRRLPR